jgi:hypothetical protein
MAFAGFRVSVCAVTTLVVTAAAVVVAADTPQAVFQDFGLFGTWATDCDAPAGPWNPVATYFVSAAGRVTTKRKFDERHDNMAEIVSARQDSPTQLSYVSEGLPDRVSITVVLKKDVDGSIREWSITGPMGEELVTSGRRAFGGETLPQIKCPRSAGS